MAFSLYADPRLKETTMFFSSWLRKTHSSPLWTRRHSPGRAKGRFLPRIELLEDRAVPAILNVTTTADVVADDGYLSLREAVLQANSTNGADIINVPAGNFAILANGDIIRISSDVKICGAGANLTVLDGLHQASMIFAVERGSDVTISAMTFENVGAPNQLSFGALWNSEGCNLTVSDCSFIGNFGGHLAGGIYNRGTLFVSDSTLIANSSIEKGGGISNEGPGAICTIVRTALIANTSSEGGGIYNNGSVTMKDCWIVANIGTYTGGGISNYGELLVQNTLLANNSGTYGGGLAAGGSATLVNCSILDNTAVQGGGINGGGVTITSCVIAGNHAAYGGGLVVSDSTIRNSTIRDNRAGELGGGIVIFDGVIIVNSSILNNHSNRDGGGIACIGWTQSILRDCLVTGNSASESGAGILNASAVLTLTISSCTISENHAGSNGGGIVNFGTMILRNSTVLNNTAALGLDVYNAGLLFFFDSIIGDRYDA